jgi:hypothetical protein
MGWPPYRVAVRRKYLGIAGGVAGLVALGGIIVWSAMRPAALGLEQPRIVLTSGEVSVDGSRIRVAQVLPPGATLRTGHGNACFSVHASRVCVGANAEAVLSELGAATATIQATRGTFIAASAGDELRLVMPGGAGAVVVRVATVAIEEVGTPNPAVRALDGNVTVQSTGQPEVVLTAPGVIGQRDGKKRPPATTLEAEERAVVQLAGSWQGSAGSIIQVEGLRGRVDVDGAEIGLAPAAVLVVEGTHTLIVRDSGRETTHESLKLTAGQKLVRGG